MKKKTVSPRMEGAHKPISSPRLHVIYLGNAAEADITDLLNRILKSPYLSGLLPYGVTNLPVSFTWSQQVVGAHTKPRDVVGEIFKQANEMRPAPADPNLVYILIDSRSSFKSEVPFHQSVKVPGSDGAIVEVQYAWVPRLADDEFTPLLSHELVEALANGVTTGFGQEIADGLAGHNGVVNGVKVQYYFDINGNEVCPPLTDGPDRRHG